MPRGVGNAGMLQSAEQCSTGADPRRVDLCRMPAIGSGVCGVLASAGAGVLQTLGLVPESALQALR
ncbi:hypothetical protein XthCFBP4691_15920 [Xanthomonas theicola]|uniref:Uncharacterized protein n=1 Tax=Xanthomonas theicola TaxID=56464 RepID=A0A2S6ZCA0_9XANT|nr:hypothetical protein XthCFBP4691_15920 [Xanthomonas theicola]